MKNNKNFYEILYFILGIIKPFKGSIIVMFGVSVVNALNISLRAYFLKLIINGLEKGGTEKLYDNVFSPICLYLAIYFITLTTNRIYNYFIDIKMFPKMRQNIMNKGVELLMNKNYIFYQENYSGNLTNKINDLKNSIPTLITLIVGNFFYNFLTLLLAFITLWNVNPRFGMLMAVALIVFLGIVNLVSKNIGVLSAKSAEYASITTGKLVDLFSNIIAVHLFASKEKEKTDFDQVLTDTTSADQKLQWSYLWMWLVYGYSFFLLQLLNFYFLYQGRKEGIISIGDFTLVLTINISLIDLLWNIGNQFSEFSRITGVISQAIKPLIMPLEIEDKPNAINLEVNEGKIKFENVNFNYNTNRRIFNNLSVEIKAGEKVGLVGYSGGGKTSFVNLILRLYNVDSGKILIDGQNIKDVKQLSLLSNISIIPQEPALFHRSLFENIKYGKPDSTPEEVIEAAKKAHAHEFILQSKEGYATLVGEKGLKLSGGQRQRIAIARAILKNAPILVLDEATSQLDTITENIIQECLWKLMQNKTTIVIAHRLSTILHMDRILVFKDGQIVEDGKHEELLNKVGMYKTLWDAQESGLIQDE